MDGFVGLVRYGLDVDAGCPRGRMAHRALDAEDIAGFGGDRGRRAAQRIEARPSLSLDSGAVHQLPESWPNVVGAAATGWVISDPGLSLRAQAKLGDLRIALFFTGHRHAGENLAAVLQQRASALGRPIQMCDALSRNVPKAFETILANCLTHGRRQFVDVAVNFPEACLYVLTILKDVYQNDAVAKNKSMSAEARLQFHQAQSGPKMEALKTWLIAQIEERKVEPNSGLGQAIAYMRKHWDKLTLFLRQPGAPLDNNICEQALKKAILHRKNAYFYKTENGAHVGDLFMSLIHTCELNGINAFDYLTELNKHADELARTPADWMPWTYRDTLAKQAPPQPT